MTEHLKTFTGINLVCYILNMIFIGVDPGVHGGIAILEDGNLQVYPMPIIGDKEYDIQEIKNIVSNAIQTPQSHDSRVGRDTQILATIERQHCMPGEGLPRTFKTGFGFGMLCGLFSALDVPFQIVGAKEWQSKIFKGLPLKQDTKVSSAVIAKRLFPNTDFRASERSRKIADGMTDATCIAVYTQRFYEKKFEETTDQDSHVCRVLSENPNVCIICGKIL